MYKVDFGSKERKRFAKLSVKFYKSVIQSRTTTAVDFKKPELTTTAAVLQTNRSDYTSGSSIPIILVMICLKFFLV